MENLNYNVEIAYFRHIGKQLLKNLFSEARFEIYLKKAFHPEETHNYEDVFMGDDLTIRILSKLAEKNIDYYLKNLEVVVGKGDYEIVCLKYDYYSKNEIVIKTNIKFNLV